MTTQGRPTWYKPDMGLAGRMVLTMFLLGAVYVVFAGVLGFFLHINWIFLAVIAVVIAGIQFSFADKIALSAMGARIVSEQEQPELHDLIGRLAAQANLPKPQVAFVNTSVPNAFATGRDKNHAVVCVTSSLYQQLDPPELEGVLAHEMTHIINRDMLVMTVATFFSMVASLIVQNFFWFGGMGMGGGYRGGGRNNDGEGGLALVLLASVITYALSFVLIRTLSRYRELAADRGAALITGAPEHLASALTKISGMMGNPRIPQRDFRQAQAVSALFIVPALRGDSLQSLFSTHPSLEARLEQLNRMQAQMEHAQPR
ncbi:MAG TPA: zinc metalloprotease HtpX [Ktedonobacterales bacterium]